MTNFRRRVQEYDYGTTEIEIGERGAIYITSAKWSYTVYLMEKFENLLWFYITLLKPSEQE